MLKFKIEMEPEQASPIGYFAYDTAEENRAAEKHVLQQVQSGNDWAWCSVRVYVEFSDGQRIHSNWLGCCSYENEKDFRENSGYFRDMCKEVQALLREAK